MLQDLLKLNGIKKLGKNSQSFISGGGAFGNCDEDPQCPCTGEPGDYILQAC
ncbi:hypothetical protein [Aquimarina algicola]|uniref:hypothetical protein n=1 Tax=Aquimarina algicola TaxID=2589995 RepID=UPI001CF3CDD2|nr:hypothetical protein [Aquimarina algicola]